MRYIHNIHKYIFISLSILSLFFASYSNAGQIDIKAESEKEFGFTTCDSPAAIKSIILNNNKVVGDNSILYLLKPYICKKNIDGKTLDEILKTLISTQFFSNVNASFENGILTITVEENKLINDVLFEGNKSISSKNLSSEVKMKARTILSINKLNHDIKKIKNLYYKSGKFNVSVRPYIITRPNQTNVLVFKIKEGSIALINKIVFRGNDSFSSDELRSILFSQEYNYFNFLSRKIIYDADISSYNEEILRRFYTNNGFINFQIHSVIAELNDARNSINIYFNLDEGQRYKVNEITIENKLNNIELDIDKESLLAKKGQIFKAQDVISDVDIITEYLNNISLSSPNVSYRYETKKEENLVDIIYTIADASFVYVDKINILGNKNTKENVIRRELAISEGDTFNLPMIRKSYTKLLNMDYFKKIDINTKPGERSDRVELDIDLIENHTGDIRINFGFSSQDALSGTFAINERNLFGRGNSFQLLINKTKETGFAKLGFYFPYFLDNNYALGFDLFASQQLKGHGGGSENRVAHDHSTSGVSVFESFKLSENLSMSFSQLLSYSNIYNISKNAPDYIKDEEGRSSVNQLGIKFAYANLDSNVEPTSGIFAIFKNDLAGLIIGNAKFFRTEGILGYYFKPFEKKLESWVMQVRFKYGALSPYQNYKVRLSERFYLGGNDFRGFAFKGVGPKDISTGYSLGGKYYSKIDIELTFPLIAKKTPLSNSFSFKGIFFIEAGTLFGVDNFNVSMFDSTGLRASVGFGFYCLVPGLNVPMRFDFAIPIMMATHDIAKYANFMIG